jgi:hypothetical protein
MGSIVINKNNWDNYLNRFPLNIQDLYYSYKYYKIYEINGDGVAECFFYEENGDIAMYPFLKNSINKLGFSLDDEYFDIQGAYGYNGVISTTNDTSFIDNFYASFSNYCNDNNIIAEFTRFHPNLNNQFFSQKWMNVFFDRNTVSLNLLPKKEQIWTDYYSSKNRNMIRKALKNNVEIFTSNDRNDYILFYSIYKQTMRNVNADSYLYFNEEYFINFINFLPENHELILAKYNNQIVGGMILLFHEDYAHYHLSARMSEYGNLALNNLFLDYSINLAKEKKCKIFHFGGGTSSEQNDSLLKFKLNFSKSKSDFYIGKKIHNESIYKQVIDVWESNNPEKKDYYKNILLKYRF